MSTGITWDDKTWDEVWERLLDQFERHNIAMAVLRGRLPSTTFERGIALELARRWRRHAVTLAVVYSVWTAFWSAIGWDAVQRYGTSAAGVPLWCAAIGVAAIAACGIFRRRMLRLTRR